MNTLHRPRASLGALGVTALVAGMLVLTQPAQAADFTDPGKIQDTPVTLETGHIDAFNPVATGDGAIQLALKEDVTGSGVLHTPESVTLKVKTQAVYTGLSGVPKLGLPDQAWYLPLTQDYNLIWPGWDTMQAGAAVGVTDLDKGRADTVISAVDGPGKVYLWSQDSWGSPASLLSGGGFTFPGTIHQDFLAHVHANWAFSEPGTYHFTVQSTVTNADTGAKATSKKHTYTFEVEPAPSSISVTGAEKPIPAGQSTVTLRAEQKPAGSTLPPTWWTRDSEKAQWTQVEKDGAPVTSATLEVPATEGVQYQARVSGGHAVGGSDGATAIDLSSDPVTLHVAAPEASVSISGAPDGHTHQGTPLTLTAEGANLPEDTTYRWEVKRADQKDFSVVGTDTKLSLTAEQALNGAQIRVSALSKDGSVAATSSVVSLEVDDHGAPPLQAVSIAGVKDHFHPGDEIALTASVAPSSVIGTWAWYVTQPGGTEAKVSGASGATLTTSAAAADSEKASDALSAAAAKIAGGVPALEDGATVRAALVKDDGTEYVTSDPVTIHVESHDPDPSPSPTPPAPDPDPKPSPEPPAPSPSPTDPVTPTPTPSDSASPKPSGSPNVDGGSDGRQGGLAKTGSTLVPTAALASLMAAAGAGVMLLARSRRQR